MKISEIPDSSWATSNLQKPWLVDGRRDIVAIGAAQGGLTAVCKLLDDLPATFDAAILLALDFGLQPASTVLQILTDHSRLPVGYATNGALVHRGSVIVAPVRHHMGVAAPGIISLADERSFSDDSPSVNRLFETCATTYGLRVIGVVLSGNSHDGTAGLKRIGAAGGIGVVQEPMDAAEARMPTHALRADHPDVCCAIDKMAPLLILLASGAMPPENLLVPLQG